MPARSSRGLRRRLDHPHEIGLREAPPFGPPAPESAQHAIHRRPPLLITLQLVKPRFMPKGVPNRPVQFDQIESRRVTFHRSITVQVDHATPSNPFSSSRAPLGRARCTINKSPFECQCAAESPRHPLCSLPDLPNTLQRLSPCSLNRSRGHREGTHTGQSLLVTALPDGSRSGHSRLPSPWAGLLAAQGRG